jgi:PTS system ascorbate-specific IIA component
MVIAPGIALAHSRPSPAVLRAGISIVTLRQPVAFGHPQNDPVRLVVGLAALDEEAHVTALSTLAEFLADPARLEALIAAETPDQVRHMVARFEEEQAAAATEGIAT